MTSIREVIKTMLSRLGYEGGSAGYSDSDYWEDRVKIWTVDRKHSVRMAVERIVAQSDFEPQGVKRLYHLPEVGEVAHAGSSLLALLKVLKESEKGDD
jgi:hypothetical protein